jgi:hypothetical protein
MDIAVKNTLNEVAMQIQVQRRSVKDIASDCAFYAKQVQDLESKALFGKLSECKTRKQMQSVLGNF